MKKEFKSESKQLLNLMIHSIYSNKDVFLRELVSNASDALDKRRYNEITGTKNEEEQFIEISTDKSNRTITIIDTGIGLDDLELDENLGTIAHSGSKEFINNLEDEASEVDIIGQFGVGFYSSFIVSDLVEVFTKKQGSDKAYLFSSDGVSEYEISDTNLDFHGSKIVLHLKEGEEFDQFLEQSKLEELVRRYNDYVKYPIYMEKVITSTNEDGEEFSEVERSVVNSQIALWKKKKSEVTVEEYNEFYKAKYYDFTDPLKVIHSHAEGTQSLDILIFIPQHKSFDFYTPNFKKGLDLYSKGILIDHSVEYLLPNHFSFVKGLVDSEDISLNISREMLQQDKQVEKIKKSISSKIKKELSKMLKNRREDYEKFYDEFGRTLTFGVYEDYGVNSNELKDLLLYKSSLEDKYVSLAEYVKRNEEFEEILYASGSSIEMIKAMPLMERVNNEKREVLYLVNDVDEFAIQALGEYESKKFVSIENANFESEDEVEELNKLTDDNKDLITAIKDILVEDVADVKLTSKLTSSAVALVNEGNISIEQEKVLQMMPENNFSAKKILELNPEHDLFKKLQIIYEQDNKEVNDIAHLLFDQALLISGLEIKDAVAHAQRINKLIISSE